MNSNPLLLTPAPRVRGRRVRWVYVVMCADGTRPVYLSWAEAECHVSPGKILAFGPFLSPRERRDLLASRTREAA